MTDEKTNDADGAITVSTTMTDETSFFSSSSPTTGVSTSSYAYIQSSDYGWIPAKIVSSTPTHVTVSVYKYTDENSIQSGVPTASFFGAGASPPRSPTRRKNISFHARQQQHVLQTEKIEVCLKDYPSESLPLQNVNEDGKLNEVEDMVDLPFLHEAAILYNLKARHLRGKPYTRTGDIVIAVNPYQWIEELYSEEVRNLYANKLVWDVEAEGDVKSTVEPHVYETSSLAYRGLAVEGQNQSILVSGESGAGKTETVKILMSHLASIQATSSDYHKEEGSKKMPRQLSTMSSFRNSPIVNRVLDSNPLLEAFGNAKTVRNDNSSRFGKFLQLQFDAEDPMHAAFGGKYIPSAILAGSKCEVYLLEKSRVVSHEEEERTYHIFYQLLAAPEEVKEKFWDGLQDTDNESFSYVGWTDTDTIEGMTDAQRWKQTVDALATVGVKDEKLYALVRALCIVLQLGNLLFEPDPENEEKSVITPAEELERLAGLMGVEVDDIRKALTERTVCARNEVYKVPLNSVRAKDSCDAFAKEIYASTFHWLVRTINDATCAEKNYDQDVSGSYGIIGLLDIFGFESFQVNRFEQLCINYANEKLQQKFTLDIFRSVQNEYEFEGIELGDVTFADNAEVLNLVEGRMGLIAVLNEECVRPKGNDSAFVSKIYTMNKDSDCLMKDKFYRDYEFGVRHYAGPVVYDATNFVTKNMDTLPSDLLECAGKCANDLVSKELGGGPRPTASKSPKPKTPRRPPGKPAGKTTLVRHKSTGGSLVSQTVWTKFRSQLESLMLNITETRTRYIRCIKPNTEKKPRVMQHLSTVEQLRCAGVVAAVTISRSAFPNRLEHDLTLERFMCLHEKGFHMASSEAINDEEMAEALKDDVDRLLTHALKSMEVVKNELTIKAFVCGKTRAYFRAGALEHLENERVKALGVWAINIQRIVRGYFARSKYVALRKAAIKVQAKARSSVARRRYKTVLAACIMVQCWTRCISAKVELVRLRREYRATMIQTHWRMAVAMSMLKQCRNAAIRIQALARGSRQRPIYRRLLAEKIEEAKLENQLKILQRKLEEAEERRVEAEKKAEEGAKTVVVYREEGEAEREETDSEEKKKEVAAAQLTAQQQTLMDESGKMLEYLRKEVFKLRSQNSQLRADFDLLKENNQRLMDANASAGASFAALNQHAKQLSKTNSKLMADLAKFKQQVTKLNLAQVELKEELKMKQATYIAEVHSRLQYQRTMARIVDTIQERCRDSRLVEDVLQMSDDCESDYMSGPTGMDTPSRPSVSSMFAHALSPDGGSARSPMERDQSLSARFKSFFTG